jgi:hypothetical protein
VGFKLDPETGQVAVSRLGDALLADAARRTGGSYRAVTRPGDSMAPLARLLRAESASGDARATGTAPGNRYEWFLGAALLLLAIDLVLADGRRERGQVTGDRGQPANSGRRREKVEVAP